jgi:hypothetical protein
MYRIIYGDTLVHHGVKGMKWKHHKFKDLPKAQPKAQKQQTVSRDDPKAWTSLYHIPEDATASELAKVMDNMLDQLDRKEGDERYQAFKKFEADLDEMKGPQYELLKKLYKIKSKRFLRTNIMNNTAMLVADKDYKIGQGPNNDTSTMRLLRHSDVEVGKIYCDYLIG